MQDPVEELGDSSDCPVFLSSDSDIMVTPLNECVVCYITFYTWIQDDDKNDKRDLIRWRQIRENQDNDYQESLKVDSAKVNKKVNFLDSISISISVIQEQEKLKLSECQYEENEQQMRWQQVSTVNVVI